VTGGEVSRLEALERTLVGAAAGQVQRRRLRRRRVVVLLALAAPLILAAAASLAATQGVFVGLDQKVGTLGEDTLIARTEQRGGLGAAFAVPAVNHKPEPFPVTGVALYSVTAVGLRARDLIRHALAAVRNALSAQPDELRGTGRLRGAPIVRTRGGVIKPVPLPVTESDRPTPNVPSIFPGIIGAGDTAA
jgi:hypothetical protein